ncbi:MAG TPA: polyphenol oxidase family protein [Gemmatimonadota bacterium]|nr:polyphenol oxidase family protein [Gemmatimonadota bacterium]
MPRLALEWPDSDLVAGTTTRRLNFGRHTGDAAHLVSAAHHALREWVAGRFDGVVGGEQVHGTRLFRADGIAVPESHPRSGPFFLKVAGTDGFLTATPGVLLTVGVADCVPAFLYAREPGAVALLHAGWRGVAASILSTALDALESAYGVRPSDCLAYWGPAIGGCCYPVGEEVVEAIHATSAGSRTERWLTGEAGRWRVDLRGALTAQAESCGVPVGATTASTLCTSCQEDVFHSYRRARGAGGRMLAYAGRPARRAPGQAPRRGGLAGR